MGTKPAPVEPPRHFAPRGIAALLAPIVRPALRKRGASLAILIEDWPAIVGAEIGARSVPVKCAAGTLTLGCAGPDALELQHQVPALIARINLALGGAPIARVRFVDLPPSAAAPVTVLRRLDDRRGEAAVPSRAGLPDGPIGDALARLRDGIVRRDRR